MMSRVPKSKVVNVTAPVPTRVSARQAHVSVAASTGLPKVDRRRKEVHHMDLTVDSTVPETPGIVAPLSTCITHGTPVIPMTTDPISSQLMLLSGLRNRLAEPMIKSPS